MEEGDEVSYSVSKTGYVTQSSSYTMTDEDHTLNITLQEEVAETDLTGVSHLYRKNANYGLYSDVTFETAFNATFNNQSYQIIADPAYYITTETIEYTLLRANGKNVVDEDGYQLVLYDGEIYKVVDGTPETTSVDVTDEVLQATLSFNDLQGYVVPRSIDPSTTKYIFKYYEPEGQGVYDEYQASYGSSNLNVYFNTDSSITIGGNQYLPLKCMDDENNVLDVYNQDGYQIVLYYMGGGEPAGYSWSVYLVIDNAISQNTYGQIMEPGE